MSRGIRNLLLVMLVAGATTGCQFLRVQPPPPPAGTRDCIGLPEGTCKDMLAGRMNERVGVELAGYRISCKSAICDDAGGEAEASLLWADGMTETFTYTWFGPAQ